MKGVGRFVLEGVGLLEGSGGCRVGHTCCWKVLEGVWQGCWGVGWHMGVGCGAEEVNASQVGGVWGV